MPYSSAPSLKARNSRIEVSAVSEPGGATAVAVAVAVLMTVKARLLAGWGGNGRAVEPLSARCPWASGIFGRSGARPMRE